jgi:hypothetical protein
VNQINDAPVAVNDISSTDEDVSVAVNVLANDSDVDNSLDFTSVIVVTQPINGQASVNNASGVITYTPVADFNGIDSFTYSINDGVESSDPATVLLTITPINDAPVANDDAATVDEGQSIIIAIRGNDVDEETPTAALTVVNLSSPAFGTVSNNNNGTVTYVHDGSLTSTDSFSYAVNDGELDSFVAVVTIGINSTPDPAPMITSPSTLTLDENTVNDSAVYTAQASVSRGYSIVWDLVDENNIFVVNGASGVITVSDNSLLDYETISAYTLQLSATDDGMPAQTETISLFVTIDDINEKPILVASPNPISISESAVNGTLVTDVSVNDPENNSQLFAITAGNADGVFAIDATGSVSIVMSNHLDFETITQYLLTVTVTDGATSAIFETIDITVDVTGVVENLVLTLDTTFGINGESTFNTHSLDTNDEIADTVLQFDGKIILVVNTDDNIAVVRMNRNGSVDQSYGDNGRTIIEFDNIQTAERAILDMLGNLYIAGSEDDNISGEIDPIVVKVNSSGLLDVGFGSDGKFQYITEGIVADGVAMDILLYSDGDLYLAIQRSSTSLYRNVLELFRLDTMGKIVSKEDGGSGEYDVFGSNSFYPEGIEELPWGELVIFGTVYDPEGDLGVIIAQHDNFAESALVASAFDIETVASGGSDSGGGLELGRSGGSSGLSKPSGSGGTSDDIIVNYTRIDDNNFILAGGSTYLNGILGEYETAMLKVTVNTSMGYSVDVDSTFAGTGVFSIDADEDPLNYSMISDLGVDDEGDITYIADHANDYEGSVGYITGKISRFGDVDNDYPLHRIQNQVASVAAAEIIVDPSSGEIHTASGLNIHNTYDILFQGLSSEGDPFIDRTVDGQTVSVLNTNIVNIGMGPVIQFGVTQLSVAPYTGQLVINSEAAIDDMGVTFGTTLSLVDTEGQVDHTFGGGYGLVSTPSQLYGPWVELPDGNIVYTTFFNSTDLKIHRTLNGPSEYPFDGVAGFTSDPINVGSDYDVTDISFDATNNHVIIVGTVNGNSGIVVVKIDASNGSLISEGNYIGGVCIIPVVGTSFITLERAIVQSDGTILGLGIFDAKPSLVKITANCALDVSFNASGIKIFDLGFPAHTYEHGDLVQLADTSLVFSVYSNTSSISHIVKTDIEGNLVTEFASNGILDLAIGATSTFINNIILDSSKNMIIAAGYGVNADADNLVVAISPITGILDARLNGLTTPGYWMFDDGPVDTQLVAIYDTFSGRIILSTIGPFGDGSVESIRLRAYNLIQDDIPPS